MISYEDLPFVGYDNRLLLGAGLLFGAFKHLDNEKKPVKHRTYQQ
jgi:hypothetical protein